MTRNYDELTHSTASVERLIDHTRGTMGSDGLQPDALKYLWPGAITQQIESAVKGELFPDPENGREYNIAHFGPDTIGLTHNDRFVIVPPLVVKPDPLQETADVRARLHAVAAEARAVRRAARGHRQGPLPLLLLHGPVDRRDAARAGRRRLGRGDVPVGVLVVHLDDAPAPRVAPRGRQPAGHADRPRARRRGRGRLPPARNAGRPLRLHRGGAAPGGRVALQRPLQPGAGQGRRVLEPPHGRRGRRRQPDAQRVLARRRGRQGLRCLAPGHRVERGLARQHPVVGRAGAQRALRLRGAADLPRAARREIHGQPLEAGPHPRRAPRAGHRPSRRSGGRRAGDGATTASRR